MIEITKVQNLVKTSYSKDDVIVLLKDLSADMKEMSTEEREAAIQSGTHYSEMLPEEKAPSEEYESLYNKALTEKKVEIAEGIAKVAEIMWAERVSKNDGIDMISDLPIIVSLARAGIPVGILIKRYLKHKYGVDCPHYAISIIRDKGIDENAMNFIHNNEIANNKNTVGNIFFVDGWTGKGAIKTQLDEAVEELKNKDLSKWDRLSNELYVLADPANITYYCGTHADYLLPSACLNSTVSGLTSRTILNSNVDVKAGDFHGATYFEKFESIDKSNEFIDSVSNEFANIECVDATIKQLKDNWCGMDIVNDICTCMNVEDFKKVKPGIGETTRVLLRRVPWKVLINKDISEDDPDIQHILVLCKEKNIPTMRWDLGNYKVCGIIKELSADA